MHSSFAHTEPHEKGATMFGNSMILTALLCWILITVTVAGTAVAVVLSCCYAARPTEGRKTANQ